jgi:sterol desaturase/sphingolipid hydroxylase (fatty acid hydroxylase superfamily)
LIFTTAEWHALHHSLERDESDQNFGCALIIWDRVFGTFNGNPNVVRVGNGTGEQLSLYMQLTMPFRSDETLKNL